MSRFFYWIFLFSSLCALEIEIGTQILHVEVASTVEQRKIGLSKRTEVPAGTGMLFVYDPPQMAHFWMKDTLVPLSIGFFNADQILICIQEMPLPLKKDETLMLYSSPSPISYALEVPKGWFTKHNIKKGMKLKIHIPK